MSETDQATHNLVDGLAALFAVFYSVYLGSVLAWHIHAYFFSGS